MPKFFHLQEIQVLPSVKPQTLTNQLTGFFLSVRYVQELIALQPNDFARSYTNYLQSIEDELLKLKKNIWCILSYFFQYICKPLDLIQHRFKKIFKIL